MSVIRARSLVPVRMAVAVVAFCCATLGVAQTVGEQVFQKVAPSVVTVTAGDSTGTGFLVRDKRTFVTAAHVIDNGETPYIQYGKGTVLSVSAMAVSMEHDLAILRVEDEVAAEPLLLADRDTIQPGAQVFAIGTALGALTHTLTDGMFSAMREIEDIGLIQVTSPFSPGMSGGPVLTKDGGVLGVISFSFSEGQNLNIAVAARHVRTLLEQSPRPAALVCAELRSGTAMGGSVNESPGDGRSIEEIQSTEAWQRGRLQVLAELYSSVQIASEAALQDFYRLYYESSSIYDWRSVSDAADLALRTLPLINIGGESHQSDISVRAEVYLKPEEYEQLSKMIFAIARGLSESSNAWGEHIISSKSSMVSTDARNRSFDKSLDCDSRVRALLFDCTKMINSYASESLLSEKYFNEHISPLAYGPWASFLGAHFDPDRPMAAAIRWAYPDSEFHPGDVIVAVRKLNSDWVEIENWRDVYTFIFSLEKKQAIDVRLRSGRELHIVVFGPDPE